MTDSPAVVPAVVVVGNPRPGSRTADLAGRVHSAIAGVLGSPWTDAAPAVLDLAALTDELGAPLGAGSATRWAGPLQQLLAARLVVVATPTYKASYTGLLKSFLDHVGGGALAHAVAVPVATVGSPAHALAVDVHLRPLLTELGASVPTAAVVATETDLADPDRVVASWRETAAPVLRLLLADRAGVPA